MCALLILTSASCTKYRKTGEREVISSNSSIKDIEYTFIHYFPISGITFPDDKNNKLTIILNKNVLKRTEHQYNAHTEEILEREIGPIEYEADKVNKSFSKNFILGTIELALSPLRIIVGSGSKIRSQTKYKKKSGSDKKKSSIKLEEVVRTAYNVRIKLDGYGVTRTNENGEATFIVNASEFDTGKKIHNIESGDTYLIKREIIFVKGRADWYEPIKLASDIATVFQIIYKVRRGLILGSGPYAIVVAVVTEIATGLVVGFVLDIASTTKHRCYRWSLIKIPPHTENMASSDTK